MHVEFIDSSEDLIAEGCLSGEELKAQSQKFAEYFRDLSVNYSEYQRTNNWPARPEGLKVVEPMDEAALARKR